MGDKDPPPTAPMQRVHNRRQFSALFKRETRPIGIIMHASPPLTACLVSKYTSLEPQALGRNFASYTLLLSALLFFATKNNLYQIKRNNV